MPDTVSRVAVHNGGDTIDLALPSTVALGQLLPTIVDIVHNDHDLVAGGRWRLHRYGSGPLDESLTLRDHGVDDGESLWLTTDDPPSFRWTERDACHVVAKAATTGASTAYVSVAVGMVAASGGAAALIWSAHSTTETPWFIGAGLSAAATVGAGAARRSSQPPQLALSCSLIAVLFAAVAGAVAVPAGPLVAHLLLASAAAFAVSTLLLRLTGCSSPLTAVATLALLAAIVSMGAVMVSLQPTAAGTALATLSLAAMSAAPRMTAAITRIDATLDDRSRPAVDERRAAFAHNTFTGLLAGSSLAAAVGAVLVGYGQAIKPGSPLSAIIFTTVVGVVMMLRARTHPDPVRRSVLIATGSLTLAVSFAGTVMAAPHAGHWLGVVAAAAAAGAMAPLRGWAAGPSARRVAAALEYAALAAIVPLACWVGGVYRLVRDSALL